MVVLTLGRIVVVGLHAGGHHVSQRVHVGPGLAADLLQVEEDHIHGLIPLAVVAGQHGQSGTAGALGVHKLRVQGSRVLKAHLVQVLGNGAAAVKAPCRQPGGGVLGVGHRRTGLIGAAHAVLTAEQAHQVDVRVSGQLVGHMVHILVYAHLIGDQGHILALQVLLPFFAFQQNLGADFYAVSAVLRRTHCRGAGSKQRHAQCGCEDQAQHFFQFALHTLFRPSLRLSPFRSAFIVAQGRMYFNNFHIF